jgi:hypothetical protein
MNVPVEPEILESRDSIPDDADIVLIHALVLPFSRLSGGMITQYPSIPFNR